MSKRSKMFSLDEEVYDKLMKEKNASGLVNSLLISYYEDPEIAKDKILVAQHNLNKAKDKIVDQEIKESEKALEIQDLEKIEEERKLDGKKRFFKTFKEETGRDPTEKEYQEFKEADKEKYSTIYVFTETIKRRDIQREMDKHESETA